MTQKPTHKLAVQSLGYVVIETTDLAKWDAFLQNVVGAMPGGIGADGSALYRLDDRAARFRVQLGTNDRLTIAGWELSDASAFDAMVAALRAAGHKAVIGDECIIGALAFVPANFKCDARKLIVGSPAKIIRDVSDEMIKWKTEGTKLYQELAREGKDAIQLCEPFTEFVQQIPTKVVDYSIWDDVK